MSTNDGFVKRSILCYGDSNTWGCVPGSSIERFPANVRWPGALSKLLRTDIRVLEEGLCGRTAISDDPLDAVTGIERNGFKTFGAILDTHSPLDLVVIMLGTFDLKQSAKMGSFDIAEGVAALAEYARAPIFGPGFSASPDVLVICPPSIWEVDSSFGPRFANGREASMELRNAFRVMAKRYNIPVIYAEDFIQSDPADGIHLSADSHAVLGQEIARWILEKYGDV